MGTIKYSVEYLTNFDLGYQFKLPKDDNQKDEKNRTCFFCELDKIIDETNKKEKIIKSENKDESDGIENQKFFHCMECYDIGYGIMAYVMESGTVTISIKDDVIYEVEQVDGFAEEIFSRRSKDTKTIIKKNSEATGKWADVVNAITEFRDICYDARSRFLLKHRVLDYRIRTATFNSERFKNHNGFSFLHCIYNFISYKNDELFRKNVSNLINYYEANSIESDGNTVDFEHVENLTGVFKNEKVSEIGFEFSRQAWAKYNCYPYALFKRRIIYYLNFWYNYYNVIYNFDFGIPRKRDLFIDKVRNKLKAKKCKKDNCKLTISGSDKLSQEEKNKPKLKGYKSIHLTMYENALNYKIDKLNNTDAEIIPEINKIIDKGLIDSIKVVEYLKKALIVVKAKQNILDATNTKKARRSVWIIKMSTLIFTALSAFKTTIDVINQEFSWTDGLVLGGIMLLLIIALLFDSAYKKK